jgi:hypothetical protein
MLATLRFACGCCLIGVAAVLAFSDLRMALFALVLAYVWGFSRD